MPNYNDDFQTDGKPSTAPSQSDEKMVVEFKQDIAQALGGVLQVPGFLDDMLPVVQRKLPDVPLDAQRGIVLAAALTVAGFLMQYMGVPSSKSDFKARFLELTEHFLDALLEAGAKFGQ